METTRKPEKNKKQQPNISKTRQEEQKVTTNLNRSFELKKIRLAEKNLLSSSTKLLNLSFIELHLFRHLAAFRFQ